MHWVRCALFADRTDAGTRLGRELARLAPENPYVLAIPNGGAAVGVEVARELACPLALLVVRKIQLPWTTEGGFGALTTTDEVVLNHELVRAVGLTQQQVEEQIGQTRHQLKHRRAIFGWAFPPRKLPGRTALLVDDGLASGVTMAAAARSARELSAGEVWVSVPVASDGAMRRVAQEVDRVVALHVDRGPSFAVASFYRHWRDLSDKEVLDLLAGIGMTPPGEGRQASSGAT